MIITEKWGKSILRHFFNSNIAIQIRNLLSLSMFSKGNVASVIIHYIPVKFHSTVSALPEVIKEINTIITDREKSTARRGNCICTSAYV